MINWIRWVVVGKKGANEALRKAKEIVLEAHTLVSDMEQLIKEYEALRGLHATRIAVLEKAMHLMLNATYEERKRVLDEVMSKEKQDAVIRVQ